MRLSCVENMTLNDFSDSDYSTARSLEIFGHLIDGFELKGFGTSTSARSKENNSTSLGNVCTIRALENNNSGRRLLLEPIDQSCVTAAPKVLGDSNVDGRCSDKKRHVFLADLPNPDVVFRKKTSITNDLPLISASVRSKRQGKDTFKDYVQEIKRKCSLIGPPQLSYGSFTPVGSMVSSVFPVSAPASHQLRNAQLLNNGNNSNGFDSSTADVINSHLFQRPASVMRSGTFVNPKFSGSLHFDLGNGELRVMPSFNKLLPKVNIDNCNRKNRQQSGSAVQQSPTTEFETSRKFSFDFCKSTTPKRQPFSNVTNMLQELETNSSQFDTTQSFFNQHDQDLFARKPSTLNSLVNSKTVDRSWAPKFPKLWYT